MNSSSTNNHENNELIGTSSDVEKYPGSTLGILTFRESVVSVTLTFDLFRTRTRQAK
jgi:hypothetical protein